MERYANLKLIKVNYNIRRLSKEGKEETNMENKINIFRN
jgi:hypothetical protein